MRFSQSMASSLATTLLALLLAAPVHALDGASTPELMGCYKSKQGLKFNDTANFQSSGHCQEQCVPIGNAVMAMTGETDCWCGDLMPPLSDKVDISKCDGKCVGWQPDNCGSKSGETPAYYAVWNSGLQSVVTNAADSSSSSSSTPSPTQSSAPSTASAGRETVVVTAPGQPTESSTTDQSSSGPSTAGIAAGVVVGIIVIAAIIGGLWFYMRAKRRREVEEEYKRQAAVSAFVGSGKPTSSAGSSHDTRLDPAIMTQRRMSDGSIADNQDYSRRILKVTNA